MSELPKGWIMTQLGDVGEIIAGQSPSSVDVNQERIGLPFYQGKAEFGPDYPEPRKWCETPMKVAPKGTVLVSVRAPVGPTNYAKEASGIGRGLASIAALCGIPQSFLRTALRFVEPQLKAKATGTTFEAITSKVLREQTIPLPPLAEQKRIVAKLDALSARTARACKDLARIDTLVTRYKQAVLSKAFRASQGARLSLEQLVRSDAPIRYGVLQPGKIKDVGVQMIRVCDLIGGRVAWDELRRIDPYIDSNFAKARVADGDVLLSVVGTIGRVALVSGLKEPTNIARAVARLRPDTTKVLPQWFALRLQSTDCQAVFLGDAREVARKTLNVSKVRSVKVEVPSLQEQQETVRRIESAFLKIDRLAAEAKRALELTDKLDEAILAKAFRGELVPQDPNDEPASVLLERIKAEREAAPKAKRGRKKAEAS